tara:strand:- start:8788 stop:10140 length:1353 start_codon:yes stop_codon:yes gene_type:complete
MLCLTACTTYQPRSLENYSPLATNISELQVKVAALRESSPTRYVIDPSDGLDLTEVGMLAVINNPELRRQRAQWQVAGAQAFAAGLLPDPQLSYGLDKPTGNNSGLVNAWAMGLSYDIIPLITRQARVDAARTQQDKVRLDLLWQEWQVIQQARTLAVRLQLEADRLTLLYDMRKLYTDRYQRSARALQDGDITLDVNGTDLTALVDTLSQINQLQQTHNQTRHDFNLLLGLAPDVEVKMATLPPASPLIADTVSGRLAELSDIRPDLLALKAGYESQEANVRAAILAQFPSLGIGITSARDTGNVKTAGFSISLTLPLLNGNRGNIAIERATRELLQQEYFARLAQVQVDVDRLLDLQTLLQEQSASLQTYLPVLKVLVDRARRAYDRGDIDALTFLNMESTWVNRRLEEIGLTQSAWENSIALNALLALPGLPTQPLLVTPATPDATP